jgi:sRNA-binding carbon storage regulator CsrA
MDTDAKDSIVTILVLNTRDDEVRLAENACRKIKDEKKT